MKTDDEEEKKTMADNLLKNFSNYNERLRALASKVKQMEETDWLIGKGIKVVKIKGKYF